MSAGKGVRDEFSLAKPIELESTVVEESSDSEEEPEPAKSFLRKISTNKEIKHSACTKEGYLLKQTSSFQRWKRRYFRLKGRTLYYTKDMKHTVFDEIDLTDVSIAEHSARTGAHCFQVITAFRCLSLCAASRRQMEDWTSALKTAGKRHFVEGMDCLHAMLSGQHNWHVVSHARPTYCNVCREALSGVTSHGLSCDVCKFKCHKRCAARDTVPCKWTSLASVGQHTIEDEDGTLHAPHQWLEGNLSVSAKCSVCEKACGSVLRLQDFRCLWCKSTVHALCRPMCPPRCSLGPCKVSVVPPTALHSIGTDDSWEAHRPVGCSPLLVFVNSKSGDHMGVKFLRRFKQLLNPAQVFDLMTSGPTLGLRLFKTFNQFRILVCGGDGSVGWVLSHIDKLDLHRQCQIGVLPLGTGNDLARVLGWGSTCDDDANLAHLLEKYECATIKMLDRWSICTLVTSVPEPPRSGSISELESSVATHLSQILHSQRSDNVLRSASVLCETVRQLTTHVGSSAPNNSMLRSKCAILDDKLSLLMGSLRQEVPPDAAVEPNTADVAPPEDPLAVRSPSMTPGSPSMTPKSPRDKVLMVRANSLKKAVRGILEHVEQALDEQNSQCMLPSPSTERPSICLQSVAELSSDVCVSPMLSPFRMSGTVTTSFPLRPWSPSAGSEPPWLPSSRAASSSSVSTAAAAAGDAADKLRSLQQLQSSQTSFQVPSLEVHEPSPDDSPGVDADSPSSGAATALPADRRPSEEISRLFSSGDASSDCGQVSLVDTNPLSISPVPVSVGSCLESPSAAGDMLLELPAAPSPFADSRRLSGASSCGGAAAATPTAAVVYGSVEQLLANLPYVDEPVDELLEEQESAPPRRSSSLSDLKLSTSAAGLDQEEPFMTETKWLTGVEDDAALLTAGIQLDPASVEGSASMDAENSGSDGCRIASRRVSSLSPIPRASQTSSPAGESTRHRTPIINPLVRLPAWPYVSAGVGSMLENVLMAHADALCAPASSLVGYPAAVCGDRSFQEKGVMNNYFGIGIDAKISLDFHNKREGQPQKCRSRTKNFMWYGVLGSKELIQKTCKNLEQRVRLECDGHVIPLPSLQGIVVLNIPSFMGGTNFWGRRREEDSFISPCFDDRILEVVAVFGTAQMAASRIINLQHHRIAQCQTVQITILGDDAVPVEVDGEAWAQAPGLIRITHKNRVQMLSRNRSLEASLRTWQEKQQRRQSGTLGSALTDDEQILLKEFLDSAVHLVRACKLMLQRYETLPGGMELQHTLSQTAAILERQIPPTGAPSVAVLAGHRPDVSDLVTSVRSLHSQGADFMHHHQTNMNFVGALELQMSSALSQMELELRHAHIAHGVVQFSTDPEGGLEKRRLSRGVFRLRLGRRESRSTSQPPPTLGSSSTLSVGATAVAAWRTAEVTAWLEGIGLHEYRNDFLRHDVRGPELLSLERRDLKELGIHKIGHIKRIQQAIRDIKSVP